MRTISDATLRLFHIAFLATATVGCAAAPPGPRGPLLGPGVEVGMDWSYAYGHGQGTLPGGYSTEGGADTAWAPLAVFPRRLEARVSPLPWVDVGGQVGWISGGADIRVGRPAASDRTWAFNLAAGFDTGEAGPYQPTKPTRARWLRAEAYPLLPWFDRHLRLVLAAGVDVGQFHHELPDPRPQTGFNDWIGPDDVETIRRETRLETSVGIFAYDGHLSSALLSLSPYLVLNSGVPPSACDGCERFTSYHQEWGFVLVVRGTLRHGF